jgi:hypothetical protein
LKQSEMTTSSMGVLTFGLVSLGIAAMQPFR